MLTAQENNICNLCYHITQTCSEHIDQIESKERDEEENEKVLLYSIISAANSIIENVESNYGKLRY